MDNTNFSDDHQSFDDLVERSKKARKPKAKKEKKGRGGKRPKKAPWIASYAYRYGARRPVEHLEEVNEQLLRSHLYRNKTVEFERQRRDKDASDLRNLPNSTQLIKLDNSIARRQKLLRKLRSRLKLYHMEQRNKKARWPKIEQKIKRRADELKKLWEDHRKVRNALYKTPEWKATEPDRLKDYNKEQRRLYGEFDITTTGTKGRIRRDARKLKKGPPPHFKRWDGQELISRQFPKGLSVDDVFGCKNSELRVEMVEGGIWESGTAFSRGKPPVDVSKIKHADNMKLDANGYAMRNVGNAWVYLRIGTDKVKDDTDLTKKGRPKTKLIPVWTKFSVNLHRPLPPNVRIKEVFLQRAKLGTSERWYFHFVLDEDTRNRVPDPKHATTGHVSIDVGWRLVPCNGEPCGFNSKEHEDLVHGNNCPRKAVRVAYWAGSDGKHGALVLPSRMLCAYYKAHDIQSIRDNKFNDIRSDLRAWMKANTSIVPKWLSEQTRNMHLWHEPVRLVKVVFYWEQNRFDGGDDILETLECWRKKDKHLLNYERNLSDQVQNQRKNIYRNFVADLRKRYATVSIEDIDLRTLAKRKEPESAHLEAEAARRHRTFAAISILRSCIEEKMRTVKVPAAGTSYTCSHCNKPAFVGSTDLVHTCSHCGKTWDRDHNAAINILVRGMKQDADEQAKAAKTDQPDANGDLAA